MPPCPVWDLPGQGLDSIFSPDGKRAILSGAHAGFPCLQVWRALDDGPGFSGRTGAVLPGVSMSEFDLSPDGELITFGALDAEGNSHVWVAPLDRRTPPQAAHFIHRSPDLFWTRTEISTFSSAKAAMNFCTASRRVKARHDRSVPSRAMNSTGFRLVATGGSRASDPALVTARLSAGGPPVRICISCGAGLGIRR